MKRALQYYATILSSIKYVYVGPNAQFAYIAREVYEVSAIDLVKMHTRGGRSQKSQNLWVQGWAEERAKCCEKIR